MIAAQALAGQTLGQFHTIRRLQHSHGPKLKLTCAAAAAAAGGAAGSWLRLLLLLLLCCEGCACVPDVVTGVHELGVAASVVRLLTCSG